MGAAYFHVIITSLRGTRVRTYISIAMTASAGWSNWETRALLGAWGAADVQSQLDGVVRNTAASSVASWLYSSDACCGVA